MIIASGPYISRHFADTVARNKWQLVDAGGAAECGLANATEFIEPADACAKIRARPDTRILTSGEHALGWVGEQLAGTKTAQAAQLFKDKAAFRKLLQPAYPELLFHELCLEALQSYVPDPGAYPFVIKPSVGFFSIGVYTVRSPGEWKNAQQGIVEDVSSAQGHFPAHVLSQTRFLIESYIEGDEYAVDAYYDTDGVPVILNILEHRYASANDVTDRLYTSSKQITDSLEPDAQQFLDQINRHIGIRNFPLHAEFRRSKSGRLTPIEVNPLRFGGWCTTGDFAHYVWGFNSYEFFMDDAAPDWNEVFNGREDKEYSLIVLDNSTGIPLHQLRAFNYGALLKRFSRPLHLTKMDYTTFPIFGFLFVETPQSNREELDWILNSDLREFAEQK
jgi:hypothetical protein